MDERQLVKSCLKGKPAAQKELYDRFAEQMRALREPEEVRQARREAVRKLMEQHDQELRKVLDDTQYAKWEQERRAMKEKRAQRGRGMQAGEAAP